ncbi:MAG: thioesterase family protein [Alphaproteobacteria bacterium]|nr:thioesterase family protein [Alphaproteobacteria bacterium]
MEAAMGGWIETYRGAVWPRDCDVVEHMTISAYVERFGDANLALFEAVGMGLGYMERERRALAAVEANVQFHRELRVGDVMHVEGGITGTEGKIVGIGHRLIDSANGEVVTSYRQKSVHFDLDARKSVALSGDRRRALEAARVEWAEPLPQVRPYPADDTGFFATARDTAKPWEIDILGHLSFHFHVQRFSMAAGQALAAMGMNGEYLRHSRHGMSTFEIELKFLREAGAGDLLSIRSGLVHLGATSFRLVHHMVNERLGTLAAVMSQFGVHLDMDARRPAPFPAELRARCEALLVGA